MPVALILTSVGFLCLVTCIICLVALHFLPTGYNPLREHVSSYAVGRYGLLHTVQAICSGVSALCLYSVFQNMDLVVPSLGKIALLIYAGSRLLIIFFPTDIVLPRTFKGRVHVILAFFTFAGIVVAAGSLTASIIRLPEWSTVGAGLGGAALLIIVAAILFILVSKVEQFQFVAGGVERCMYLGTLLWLVLIYLPLILLMV